MHDKTESTRVDLEVHLCFIEHSLPETGGVGVSASHSTDDHEGEEGK